MVDIFVDKICYYCSNNRCHKKVEIIKVKNCTTYKCDEYKKNKTKIIPYQKPLLVTAERDYIIDKQI